MAKKQYVVVHHDGRKENIGASERDARLMSKEIVRTENPLKYKSTAQVQRFHLTATQNTLANLSKLPPSAIGPIRRYLAGTFVFVDPEEIRHTEKLETPEMMEQTLPAMIRRLSEKEQKAA